MTVLAVGMAIGLIVHLIVRSQRKPDQQIAPAAAAAAASTVGALSNNQLAAPTSMFQMIG